MIRRSFAVVVTLLLLITVVALPGQPALTAALDKDSCNRLKTEQAQLEKQGARANLLKGPTWGKANLSPEKLEDVRRVIELDEQLLFRCSGKHLVVLPPEPDPAAPENKDKDKDKEKEKAKGKKDAAKEPAGKAAKASKAKGKKDAALDKAPAPGSEPGKGEVKAETKTDPGKTETKADAPAQPKEAAKDGAAAPANAAAPTADAGDPSAEAKPKAKPKPKRKAKVDDAYDPFNLFPSPGKQ
jgi:hypothetical protein